MPRNRSILTLKELHDYLTTMLEQGEDPDQPIFFDPNMGDESEEETAEWIPVRSVSWVIVDYDWTALRNADDDQDTEFYPHRVLLSPR